MRRLRVALRFSVLAIIVVLVLGAMGSASLADAFDADYEDCPSKFRLDALSGLKATRTSEDDELKVSWAMTDPASWGLGNDYRSQITIIVEGSGDPKEASLALGRNEHEFDGISFARDLTVSVAVVRDDYVISDIAVAKFTSGLPKPTFMSPFYLAQAQENAADKLSIFRSAAAADDADKRDIKYIFEDDGDLIEARAKKVEDSVFYYLGFNHNFENWYVDTGRTYPRSPKFRVGLRHGTEAADDPGDADFDNFRVRVLDSSGQDVLGFDAVTVTDNRAYEDQVLVIGINDRPRGEWDDDRLALDETNVPAGFSSIKQSNRIDDNKDAYYQLSNSYWDRYLTPSNSWFGERVPRIRDEDDVELTHSLSSHHVMHIDKIGVKDSDDLLKDNRRQLFALPPVEIYDLPVDIFADDGNYTIEAWAENDDGDVISPKASITLNVREQFRGKAQSTLDAWIQDETAPPGFDEDDNDRVVATQYFNLFVRTPDPDNTAPRFAVDGGYREGVVLGLSIQDQ